MSDEQSKKVTLELNNFQFETIRNLFGHYDWDMKIVDEAEKGGNAQVNAEQGTQTENGQNTTDQDSTEQEEDDNTQFTIPQSQSEEECIYCFCRPCITNERNRQMWWHTQAEAPHQRNSGFRKEHYKRFWTMLLHRGAWNDDRYILMKQDAMSRDRRTQRFDWHRRDIMPKCVVSLVRQWFPNPGGFPYMGHMWE